MSYSLSNLLILVVFTLLTFSVKGENSVSSFIKNLESLNKIGLHYTIIEDGMSGTPVQLIVQKQEQCHKHAQPLFSWNFFGTINENNRTKIINFNKNNKDIIENEKKMQKILSPYADWLEKRCALMAQFGIDAPTNSSKFSAMLNGMGGASKQYCSLTDYNFFPYLLTYMPPEGNRVVLDVGSGWGACSKQLALLGYKVYSIDIDSNHIDFRAWGAMEQPTDLRSFCCS
jgi:hypothetical protein